MLSNTNDPIVKRALSISSSIAFGPGKKDFFVAMVRRHIGKHCIYCGIMLTPSIMSLDHIQPFGKTALRANKLVQQALNKPENFQIICQKCNTMKGNLDHARFKKFMVFLETDPVLKEFVYKKMTQSSLMWSYRNVRKTAS